MIGQMVVPDFLIRNNIDDRVICYIDIDKRKSRDIIKVGERKIAICSLEDIKEWNEKIFLIITNSNYSEITSIFDTLEYMNGIDAVIYPVIKTIEVENKIKTDTDILVDYCSDKIPKVIHYCWFSGNPIPDYLKKCMESWSEICPDYEIKRWDESNYNVEKNSYMKQAYEECKWGFVPDYARLDILYNYGGFYIDTDVQLVKSLEPLRMQGGFCGVEKWGNVNMGGCSGAVKHHPMIKKMLDYRANIQFKYEDGTLSYIIAPQGLTDGDKVISGETADIKAGNCMPIDSIPVGTLIHNIELNPGQGGKLVRTAGQSAQLMAKEGKYATLRLPSGEMRLILAKCRATIGVVGNADHENVKLGKAGKTRHLGIRPSVRGSVMNPVDHPHGGGEGRAPVGHSGPMTPWGKPALGYKTRNKKNRTNKFIVKRRK